MTTPTTSLRVVTYNVWFFGGFQKPPVFDKKNLIGGKSEKELAMMKLSNINTYDFEERMNAVIQECLKCDADVVCLQEMTHWSKEIFEKHKALASNYEFSFDIQGRYGIGMLVRKGIRVEKFQVTNMRSYMGRNLLHCVVMKNSKRIHIATAHFESLSNAKLRREQLKTANEVASSYKKPWIPSILSSVKGCSASILCGDFNFCSYRNYSGTGPLENLVLKEVTPEFVDLWPALKREKKSKKESDVDDGFSTPDKKKQREELGYTFDSKTNTNIKKFERMRYDRIMLRTFCGDDVVAESIELIGTDEIKEIKKHPSDHYGLFARFLL